MRRAAPKVVVQELTRGAVEHRTPVVVLQPVDVVACKVRLPWWPMHMC